MSMPPSKSNASSPTTKKYFPPHIVQGRPILSRAIQQALVIPPRHRMVNRTARIILNPNALLGGHLGEFARIAKELQYRVEQVPQRIDEPLRQPIPIALQLNLRITCHHHRQTQR